MNLQDTITSLIEREGGHSNNPNDRGGETIWGITAAVAQAFGYAGAMAAMPRETASKIYKERFWFQPALDKVNSLSASIAEELLDTGVNMGPATAGKFLQRALNVLDQQGKLYPPLGVDGALGAMTIQALKMYLTARGEDGEKVMLRMLNAQQSVRYIELAEASPSQESFEFGWQLNRVGAL
jgi:lysozyme family protein